MSLGLSQVCVHVRLPSLTRRAASFRRKVLKTFTLSNGQVIPAGVSIEASAQGVNHDSTLHSDPSKFDPFRFSRPRATDSDGKRNASASATNQLVSVNQSHLTFGLGRHACPGRFVAANEIKMILANALLRFDVKNLDGVEGRIPNFEFGAMVSADLYCSYHRHPGARRFRLLLTAVVDPGWFKVAAVQGGIRLDVGSANWSPVQGPEGLVSNGGQSTAETETDIRGVLGTNWGGFVGVPPDIFYYVACVGRKNEYPITLGTGSLDDTAYPNLGFFSLDDRPCNTGILL